MLLSGGSGLLGSSLARVWMGEGGSLLRLVRRAPASAEELRWDPAAGAAPDAGRLEGLSAAVHLSGANVAAHRWTAAYKREMTESRVNTTRIVSETLARLKQPPAVLVAASAIGYYGDRGDEWLEESSAAGTGFFPELCAQWEAATEPAEQAGIRVVHLRISVVLSAHGGALARLVPMFRLGMGGALGNGRQWMSWVSETDAVRAALFAMRNPGLRGAVNLAAPNPVTNAEFTRLLGRAVHRPAIVPAPAFALRLAFGEMADEALLASSRVMPRRLLDAGFRFELPTLAQALAAVVES